MTTAGPSPWVEVTEAVTSAEREAVQRLRQEIYIEEMGYPISESDLLHDPVDNDAVVLQLFVDGQLTGTGRIQTGARHQFSAEQADLYDLPRLLHAVPEAELALFERVMVRDSHRGGDVTTPMFFAMVERAIADGATVFLLDCQPHHVLLYERLGFRPYRDPVINVPGPVFCLAGFAQDREYLRAIGVIGADLVSGLHAPPGRVDALRALLPDRPPVRCEVPDASEYRAEVLERLVGLEDALFPAEIGDEAVTGILNSSFIAEFPAGMTVLREGLFLRTLYLVLDGDVEVFDAGAKVGTSGRGSFTGDVAFLLDRRRMSEVRAGPGGVTMLGFGVRALQQAATDAPSAAAVLYRALATDLARKLVERQATTTPGG